MHVIAAFRSLRRQPWFTLAAVATLALGLASTTVVFSVVEAVLLRPLPYADADRLLFVWQDLRARGVAHFGFSHGDFGDLAAASPSLSGVAALTTGQQTLRHDDGTPELVTVGEASANVFRVLGVPIALGPGFTDADGTPSREGPDGAARRDAAPRTAVISHALWQRMFGGRDDVLGRTLALDGSTAVVAGVLPPAFEMLAPADADLAPRPDVWLALRLDFAQGQRVIAPFRVVGRLAPGATITDAQRDVAALTADFRARFPVKNTADVHVVVAPLRDDVVAASRPTLVALVAAVTLVMLVACANVAGLIIARADRRTREIAVRAALGGSRSQVVGFLVAESLLLVTAAAIAGLAVAAAALDLVRSHGPAQVPRLATAALDPLVVAVAVVTAALSALLVGLVPALKATRVSLAETLRRGGRAGAAGRHPLRLGLVAGEVALSFVLLVAAGLMVRSLVVMQQADPGFDPEGVYAFALPQALADAPDARGARVRALRERLSALPGVLSVSAASALPLDGETFTGPYGPLEGAARPELMRQAEHRFVEPGFFHTLRTPVVAGREFVDSDTTARVVVIDTTLAQTLFPGQSAVGRQMLIPRVQGAAQPEPFEIVGVVRAQAGEDVVHAGRETVYLPAAFVGWNRVTQWVVRTGRAAASLAGPVRAQVAAFDPALALGDERPLVTLVDAAFAPTRFVLALLSAFGTLALGLTAVGLYGVLATAVAERTVEIGVRVALGADRRGVFALILRQGLALAGIGLAAGAALSVALSGVLRATIVGVAPGDPLALAGVTALFVLVVVAACLAPAWRAARVDPAVALRAGG